MNHDVYFMASAFTKWANQKSGKSTRSKARENLWAGECGCVTAPISPKSNNITSKTNRMGNKEDNESTQDQLKRNTLKLVKFKTGSAESRSARNGY